MLVHSWFIDGKNHVCPKIAIAPHLGRANNAIGALSYGLYHLSVAADPSIEIST